MSIERESFSRECVFQGYQMEVSPHYLFAVAEIRSKVSDKATIAGPGPFCLTAQEWAANQDGGDFKFGFIGADISDWRIQTQVFAYMTRQIFQPGMKSFGHPLNALELYICQLFSPEVAVAITGSPNAPVAASVASAELLMLEQRFPGLTSGTGTQTIAALDKALDKALNMSVRLIQQAAIDLEGDQHNFIGSTFDEKAPQIMKQLMADFDLSDIQTGAILGNLGHESMGLRVMQEVHPIGGGRGGYGWAQWTGDRRDKFQAWCKEQNLSMDSDGGNYGFLCHELKGEEKKSLKQLKLTSSLTVATETFALLFERPGIVNLPSRMNWARRAMAAFSGAGSR